MPENTIYTLFSILLIASTLWPFIYMHKHSLNNRFLFFSSIIGIILLTTTLITIIAAPFIIFYVLVAPSLQDIGILGGLAPLVIQFLEIFFNWGSVIIYIILCFILPIKLHRKYKIHV